MRLLFVVNDLASFVPGQTTTMLVRAALLRGHAVWVAPFTALSLREDGEVVVTARPIDPAASRGTDAVVEAAGLARPEPRPLGSFGCVCLRTNPGRLTVSPAAHALALALCERAAASGVSVHNAPTAVRRASSKLYLTTLPPSVRPPTLVTGDPELLRDHLARADGRVVLKPLEGTRGRGVLALERADVEAAWPAVSALLREGPLVAQPFVPGGERGDVRVLVLDGEPLIVDGAVAAIARIPAPGDFRSNLHAGGRAEPATLTEGMRRTLEAVGPRLRADGLTLVGVDLVGDQIIELNVASPGGLRDAERFTGRDFAGAVLERFAR